MNETSKEIKKISFIGDEKTGKTTLIKMFLTSFFPEGVEKEIRERIIIDPLKYGISQYNSLLEFKDCSSLTLNNKEEIIESIKFSNTVVFVYDFSNTNSFFKTKEFIKSNLDEKQLENLNNVIIVGNKYDQLDINSLKSVIELNKTEISK